MTPEAAVDALDAIWTEATAALTAAIRTFLNDRRTPTPEERARFRYPTLRVTYRANGPDPRVSRAFAQFSEPGVYGVDVTQPAYFRTYLVEQLTLLQRDYGATFEVSSDGAEIPYPFVLDGSTEIDLDEVDPAILAQAFSAPTLMAMGDQVVDSIASRRPDGMRPLALFEGPRVDYSLKRLVHYTGTDWKAIQPWILFTNYHRYVDAFVEWAVALVKSSPGSKLVAPGGIVVTAKTKNPVEAIANGPWRKHQMPAYHFIPADGDGITLVNIGVGPANAKTICDHLAVLRPHCWLMIGHCGGLRRSQRIGDYMLAHAYLRSDHVLDSVLPPIIPIPPIAEVQVALQRAVAEVSGQSEGDIRRRLRTGTIVTTDDRNWELRFREERTLLSRSRAIGIDMESATIAAQGFRMRVPYGTLLCVSDKPVHGEIKLPGAANRFYETAIAEHLKIGIAAIDMLRRDRAKLHSRKLRSFDEPPLR
jgi:AMP nucleosidase